MRINYDTARVQKFLPLQQICLRDFHPEKIFISMETIMTNVLEESDDDSLSLELLTPILASLKRNNEEISASARKLGESVLAKCAVKLKPYLMQAVKSLGLPLDGYSEIVATICNESNGEVEHNSGNVSVEKEKPEAAELVSKPFMHDDEIVAIDKNDQAADDYCIWNCIWNFGQISDKPEAAEVVSKLFGHDDEIVAIHKSDPAVDDYCMRNLGQISEKPEAAELVSKPFGHDDEIVVIYKNDQAAIETAMPAAKRRLYLTSEDILTQIDNTASGYNAPANDTKSQSQSQTTTSKGATKSEDDDEQSSKLEETTGLLAGGADETAMHASNRRRHLTTEDIQTEIDTNAFGDNAPEPGTKSQIQSQNTTLKRKNDEQFSKLEETIGILAVAADETAMPTSKRRRHLTIEDIQTEIDITAFGDNAPASDTKSQSQSQTTTSKRTTKSKNDDEHSSKLEETISMLAGVMKDMVDNKKLPIPVEKLWGFIHEMKLDEDLAGDAFVFLLDRPVQLKGLISTPTGIRKSILLKMMMRDAKVGIDSFAYS